LCCPQLLEHKVQIHKWSYPSTHGCYKRAWAFHTSPDTPTSGPEPFVALKELKSSGPMEA
jgi:hypothetical protein